jgi:hypothetical protein
MTGSFVNRLSAPLVGASSIGLVRTGPQDFSRIETLVGRRLFVTTFHCLYFEYCDNVGTVSFTPAYDSTSDPYGTYSADCWWSFDDIDEFDSNGDGLLHNHESAFDYVVSSLISYVDSRDDTFDLFSYDDGWNGNEYWYNTVYPVRVCGQKDIEPMYSGHGIIELLIV